MNEYTEIKRPDVLVIDYKVGNHLSIINALTFLGYNFMVSNKQEDIVNAPSYILPGVGAFGEAMKNLQELGIVDCLNEQVLVKKKPILGICLGMQVMADDSEENGRHRGLGWVAGRVIKIEARENLRVPHVGWNDIEIRKKEPLFARLGDSPNFYFDHSYHFVCDQENIAANCSYGGKITAAVQKGNIFGVQFHPEKSQNNGLKLFRGYFNYLKGKSC